EVDVLSARALAARGLDTATPDALETAAAALQGELMAGLDLPSCPGWQAWLIAEREQTAALRRGVLEALFRTLASAPERVLPHARAAVEREPHEPAWRVALIRALAAANGLREAERHYREGVRLLANDAGGLAALRRAWAEAQRGEAKPVAAAPPPRQDETLAFLTRPAVAVLPFENIGGDPEHDYLVDGFVNDLITGLCQWR